MPLPTDERFTQVDPNDPTLWATTIGNYGDIEDVVSGQDNGLPKYSPSPIIGPDGNPIETDEDVADVRSNPENYTYDTTRAVAALPDDFYKQGAVAPGDTFRVFNPKTGNFVVVEAGEAGPSAEARGLDLPPHVMKELGLDTDDAVVIKFGEDSPWEQQGESSSPFTDAQPLSLAMVGQEESEDSGQSLSGIGNDNSSYDPESQDDVLPEEQDGVTQPAVEDSYLEVDPDSLGEPIGADDDGTVHYRGGMSVLPSGFTKVNIGGGTEFIYDKEGKKVDVRHAPTPHFSSDPETGLPVATIMKDGKLVRVPTEFDEEREKSEAMLKAGVTGEDAIKDLGIKDQIEVRAYANYEKQPLAGSRNKEYNRLYPFIKTYNPDYDPRKYDTGKRLFAEYHSTRPGVAGGQLVAMRRAIQHLAQLRDKAKDLQNSGIKKLNWAGNILKEETGKPQVSAFNAVKVPFVEELIKAFKGNAATNMDYHEFEKQLQDSKSPEQLMQVIEHELPHLMSAASGAITSPYEMFFRKPFPWMDKPTEKALKSLGLDTTEFSGVSDKPTVMENQKDGTYWIKGESGFIQTDINGNPL